MKLIGYFLAYLIIIMCIMGILGVTLIVVTGIIAFATWSLPPLSVIFSYNLWTFIRGAFIISTLMGVWVASSKEVAEFVKDFVDGFDRRHK